jgi:hypothetical protein
VTLARSIGKFEVVKILFVSPTDVQKFHVASCAQVLFVDFPVCPFFVLVEKFTDFVLPHFQKFAPPVVLSVNLAMSVPQGNPLVAKKTHARHVSHGTARKRCRRQHGAVSRGSAR